MTKARKSLSSLFLNRPSGAELAHMKKLEALHKAGQGRPFFVDDDNLRMMYLNPKCMQSAMKLDAPDELVCAYSRAVMGFLLFHPRPAHILLIGLGGGSLVKYCLRHLPDCRITVLEINADVIAMREQFALPPDSERLRVIHCDAIRHLQEERYQADVLLLDAYDEQGLVAELNTAEFYATCHNNLTSGGVMVANVWGKPSALAVMLSRLRRQYTGQVCWARSVDSYNLIVYALKTGLPTPLEQLLHKTASQLAPSYPELDLHTLQDSLLSLPVHQQFATPDDELQAIRHSLAGIMVADSRVPQTYADWKKLVQKNI
ncbi:fused MFS/spermidine synthase [Undibacterium sp. TS12]|uniref:fused MFS/spermidine synthase n=1 Tax=Undibacterium sp. TS12 TaxID=2908202 RepID=UPI001F4D05FD|nr:fused MFS/spermidine synthase [Undibacterium sp. TS12]MCH8619817.1 fused MFS/spermidine synthase [Undibacterium sp. TS12]